MALIPPEERHQHAAELVKHFPDRAIQLIARHDDAAFANIVKNELLLCRIDKGGYSHSLKRRDTDDSGFEQPNGGSPPTRQHARQRSSVSAPKRPSFGLNSQEAGVPSSAASVISSASRSSRSKQLGDKVIVYDAQAEPKALFMTQGATPHSFIKAEIVLDRLGFEPEPFQHSNGGELIQYRDASGGRLTAYELVKLTWHRRDASRTHYTPFYLDRTNSLPTDLILGELDAGDDTQLNNASAEQSFPVEPPRPSRPDARYPAAPPRNQALESSYHRSSNTSYLSGSDTVKPPVPQFIGGHAQGYEPAAYGRSGDLFEDGLGNQRSRSSYSSTNPSTHAASGRANSEATASGTLKVTYVLEKGRTRGNLDTCMSADAFLASVEQSLAKIKRKIDRSIYNVRFLLDPHDEDAGQCLVQLNEADLSDDWDEAVMWIKTEADGVDRVYGIIERFSQENG